MLSLHRSCRALLAAVVLPAAAVAVGAAIPVGSVDAAASTLQVSFIGCDLRFVTVGGEGVLDGFTATATVDGGAPAHLWSDLADDVTLANHVQVEFATGASLSIQWTLEDDNETVIDQGTATFTVPPCDPPYQIRIDKVASGAPPAGNVVVRVWPGLGDGGLDCGVAPPNDALTATIPASGGSETLRVTVGQWCVAETDSRGATLVQYASTGATSNGGFHVADVAFALNPGAPVVRVVTVTNTYGASDGTAAEFPHTGPASPWVAPVAMLLLATGVVLLGLSRRANSAAARAVGGRVA